MYEYISRSKEGRENMQGGESYTAFGAYIDAIIYETPDMSCNWLFVEAEECIITSNGSGNVKKWVECVCACKGTGVRTRVGGVK